MRDAEELQHLSGDEHADTADKVAIDDESGDQNEAGSYQSEAERGTWASRSEFFLSIVGYTIGLGSVWRFPIIVARNGGGAFLIPFFFFLITCGGPLYYLEVCLGQFTGMSAGLSFEFCPLLRGIGLLQVLLSLTGLWYALMVFAWVNFYFYTSFFPTLPWTTCNNTWNTPACKEFQEIWTLQDANSTKYSSSAFEFWEHRAIGRSSGLQDMGSIQLHLAVALMVALVLILLAVIKGVKSLGKDIRSILFHLAVALMMTLVLILLAVIKGVKSLEKMRSIGLQDMGSIQLHLAVALMVALVLILLAVIKGVKYAGKVVYVTATAPYVLLTIMFIRGLTLDGAVDGILAYLKPDFSKLLELQVWLEAAIQVFYSLGPTWGGVITMASYNKFHQKSFWLSTMCVASSGFTSFYNGLVVFTIIGFMAKEAGMSVSDVATQSGPGLAFIAFPTAISRMPLPNLWSVLFFLTLILVVFDSQFGMFETITSAMVDMFPRKLIPKRLLVNICTAIAFFLTQLPLTMNGGIYVFQLSDWYFPMFGLLFGSLLEVVAISWIYGLDRFSQDIRLMMGREVSVLLRCMWAIVIPVFSFVLFIILLSKYSTPAYGDGYVYEEYAVALGLLGGMLPIIGVFIVAAVTLYKIKGPFLHRLKTSLRPSSKWAPNSFLAKKTYLQQDRVSAYKHSLWQQVVLSLGVCKHDPVL